MDSWRGRLWTEKYNSHTKDAIRACHEKLFNTKIEPGQDPNDFVFVLDEGRDLLEEMGQTVHDERYEDIILQALPPEYERVRPPSYEKRDFGLDDIRRMVHIMYVDNLSRSVNVKPVAGRSIAMQVLGHTSSNVQYNCKGFGHLTQDCAILKKEHRRGPIPGGQQHQRKQHLPRHGKARSGDATRGGDRKQWCSFHKSTMHSNADCRIQHDVGSANTGNANYAANYIDHPISFTAVEAPTEEEAFWPFGPTDEPFDTSGLFGSFGGVSGEETDDSLFMVEEEPAQQLGFREHIVGV